MGDSGWSSAPCVLRSGDLASSMFSSSVPCTLPWSNKQRLEFEVRLTVSQFGKSDIFHFQMVLKHNLVDLCLSFGRKVVIAHLNFSDSEIAGQRVLKCGSIALVNVVTRNV